MRVSTAQILGKARETASLQASCKAWVQRVEHRQEAGRESRILCSVSNAFPRLGGNSLRCPYESFRNHT